MCVFKSGIVTEKEVLTLLDSDSHTDILEYYNIKDLETPPNFVKVELIPIGGSLEEAILSPDLKNWKLKVDQDGVPDWWIGSEKWAEKEMIKALKDTIKKRCVLAGQEVKEIKDKERWFLVCGKVDSVYGSAEITNVCGSAQIDSVYGSAQINSVYGLAQITNVCGSAEINNVCGSARIEYVYGSAQINSVCDSAKINSVSDSAEITIVCDSAQINSVYGSAEITNVCGSAQIDSVYGSAQINSVYGLAQINRASDSAQIDNVKNKAIVFLSKENGVLKIQTGEDFTEIILIK